MSDVSILLQMTGNLDAKLSEIAKQMGTLATRGEQVGKRTEEGLRGAINRAREMGRRVNEFIGAGLIGYRAWSAAVQVWSGAHEAAARRINKANREAFDSAKKLYDQQVKGREQGWERLNSTQQIRMAGVDDDRQVETIRKILDTHQGPYGERIRNELFPQVAERIGQQRLSGDETGKALERAATALNRFGHVAGYGASYSALIGNKTLAGRGDLAELALGLTLRKARLGDDDRSALDAALSSGALGVGADGLLSGKGDAAGLAKIVNGLGGIGLRQATGGWDGKPQIGWTDDAEMLAELKQQGLPTEWLDDVQRARRSRGALSGVITGPRSGEAEQWALPAKLAQPPPVAPIQGHDVEASDVDPTAGDWWQATKSAFGALAAQAAAAAASIAVMSAAARLFGKGGAAGAAGEAASRAAQTATAAGAGAGAGAAAGGRLAAIRAAAARWGSRAAGLGGQALGALAAPLSLLTLAQSGGMSDEEIDRYNKATAPPNLDDTSQHQAQWRTEVADWITRERVAQSGGSGGPDHRREAERIVGAANPNALWQASTRIAAEGFGSEKPTLELILQVLREQRDLMRQPGDPQPIAEAQ